MTDTPLADDHATLSADGGTLMLQRWLPGPLDRIWRHLTDSDLRARWFAAGAMDLTPGAPLELVWRNRQLSDADDPAPDGTPEVQRMQSRILTAEPMTRLAFAWGDGAVTFTLREQGARVLLTLTHSGFAAESRRNLSVGWHAHLDILRAGLEGAPPPSLYRHCAALRPVYAARQG